MIVLALILLLIAAAAVVFIVALGLHQAVAFSFFAGDFTTNPLTIFIAGAVTLLLVLFALSLINRGTKRGVARRREIKRLRKVEQTSVPADQVVTEDAGPRTARHGRDHDLDQGVEGHRGDAVDREVDLRRDAGDETLVRPTRTNGTDETRQL